MNLGNVTGCWRKTTHGERWGYKPCRAGVSTAVYTDSQYLIMRGHTQTHTIYLYTHCVFGSLHIINTHTTNTVQDGGVKKKTKKIEGPITHLIFSHGDPRADPDKARSHI